MGKQKQAKGTNQQPKARQERQSQKQREREKEREKKREKKEKKKAVDLSTQRTEHDLDGQVRLMM